MKEEKLTNNNEDSELTSDKRKHTRYPAKWMIKGFRTETRVFTGVTSDLSVSGLSTYTSVQLKVGERVYLNLDSFVGGVKKIIDAVCVVKHVSISNNKYRCGVEFLKISPSNLTFLKKCINRIDPH